ncbi:RagB/SusD family nutrient uptake outer membrane protein [Flavivirga spongiicola]|uniref:RagB/SusD family nutrient uptake outer membrane protein n=1 Tax=Flavivirga spongiicola TaxID=421621 RepID=A0ABU7XML6_9FLAO|nr:RagB/SusD family nutrient uptake outer membrane protein [Flavivirga sp. MEBiC05379]MDO5981026.1 RagB/SusD family nutrient uptake outer membrane protein [Flavivirga sp. MEBiC05379]MDO5981465.1 RagB/SusD family nutrient uptake outer membrane protein [Flavivirga sp. MEBiC05379]
MAACTDFVEVDLPKSQLPAESIFEDASMTASAVRGVYYQMRTSGLVSGDGLNTSMGLYADELDYYRLGQGKALENYQNHTLGPNDPIVADFWNSAYTQIYTVNAIMEGVGGSASLAPEDKDRFRGEALFVRSYLHLLLAELFGDIPYITGTSYVANKAVGRMPKALVYDQITTDLGSAVELLPGEDASGERVRPYAAVAEAVLARAYLYTGEWTMAEAMADRVIAKFGALEPDLGKVFLKDAPGTIWQLKPNGEGDNTSEGGQFIFTVAPPVNIAMSDLLFEAFEPGDQRRSTWVKAVGNATGTETWHHAFKYREQGRTDGSVEYSVQLRLAEQYLIRAESRARLGDLPGARSDINAVRNRAGLGGTAAVTPDGLLGAVLQERRVELFTEQGHRWFDLKRTGRAAGVLGPVKPNWKDAHVLLPIPGTELALNPNLLPQNDGY